MHGVVGLLNWASFVGTMVLLVTVAEPWSPSSPWTSHWLVAPGLASLLAITLAANGYVQYANVRLLLPSPTADVSPPVTGPDQLLRVSSSWDRSVVLLAPPGVVPVLLAPPDRERDSVALGDLDGAEWSSPGLRVLLLSTITAAAWSAAWPVIRPLPNYLQILSMAIGFMAASTVIRAITRTSRSADVGPLFLVPAFWTRMRRIR